MSIRTRLVFGFSMLLALMVSQAFIAMSQVERLTTISNEIASRAMERVEHVSRISTALAQLRGAELAYILSPSQETTSFYGEEMKRLWGDIEESIGRYRTVINDPKRLADYEAFLLHIDKYRDYHELLLSLTEEGRRADAQEVMAVSQKEFNYMTYHIQRLRHEEYDTSLMLGTVAQGMASRSRYLFGIATLLVAVVEVGLGWYVWRSLSGGLGSLLEGTRRVSRGDLSHPVPAGAKDEFGELARAFNTMMLSLRESQEENLRLTQEALRMREERIRLLRDSLLKVVKAQEEERQRVARELHDQAGQALTALQFGLAQLEREVDSPRLKEQVESLRSLTVETMEEIRNLALDLRPSALDELGLVPALRGYIRDFSRRIGIPIELEVTGLDARLPSEMELSIFRVVQEGLTNVAKHAMASHAWVSLRADGRRLEVSVVDDGVGFDVEKMLGSPERKSLGLFGIQERVELMGGSLKVESQPGKGTRLYIQVPLNQRKGEGGPENRAGGLERQ
jgi:signal transduction histidine kinase